VTDRTSTQLYFVVGLVAALVLVPLVALATDHLNADE